MLAIGVEFNYPFLEAIRTEIEAILNWMGQNPGQIDKIIIVTDIKDCKSLFERELQNVNL